MTTGGTDPKAPQPRVAVETTLDDDGKIIFRPPPAPSGPRESALRCPECGRFTRGEEVPGEQSPRKAEGLTDLRQLLTDLSFDEIWKRFVRP